MSGLPRSQVPLYLQRYDPGSMPARRRRHCTGRSNRVQDESALATELTQHFLAVPAQKQSGKMEDSNPDINTNAHQRAAALSVTGRMGKRANGLSVQEALARSDYVSIDQSHRHPLAQQTRHAGDGPHDDDGNSFPHHSHHGGRRDEDHYLTIAQQTRAAQQRTDPAIASLLREKHMGQGRNIRAENFFMRPRGDVIPLAERGLSSEHAGPNSALMGGGEDPVEGIPFFGTIPPGSAAALSNFHQAQHPAPERTITTVGAFTRLPIESCGGGALEYNHPLEDAYCRNELVARYNIQEKREGGGGGPADAGNADEFYEHSTANHNDNDHCGAAAPSSVPPSSAEGPRKDNHHAHHHHQGGGSSCGAPSSAVSTQNNDVNVLVIADVAPHQREFAFLEAEKAKSPQQQAVMVEASASSAAASVELADASRRHSAESRHTSTSQQQRYHNHNQQHSKVSSAQSAQSSRRLGSQQQQHRMLPAISSDSFAHPSRRELHDAAWIAQYTPYPRPYDVPPCLGRCGRTDYHATFNRTQADPHSSMYASDADRFVTTKAVPLFTPNMWQERTLQGKR